MGDEVTSSSKADRKPRPATIELVKEAIRETNEPRKGVSVPALKNWIFANYPEVDQTRFGTQLKKALVKALDEGIVERPASSTTTGTLTGRYKLGKALKDADKKAAAKKVSDAKKAAKAAEGGGGRSRAPSKKAMDKKLHRRSLSLGASTPKPKKSKSKLHAVPRRAQSHSPVKTPMKSPKVAKKAAAKKKTPTKKAKKSPAKKAAAKKATKKKSPAAKAKKPAAKAKGKKGSTS